MTARDFLVGCALVVALLAYFTFAGWLSETVAPTTAPGSAPLGEVRTEPGQASADSTPSRRSAEKASRSRPSVAPTVTGSPLPLLLQAIRWCESRDDYRAENPHSTASGAFQVLDGTWNRYAGYRHAADAPRRVQDAKALALYLDRGTKPWAASRRCWS